jgi:hypothetical protein
MFGPVSLLEACKSSPKFWNRAHRTRTHMTKRVGRTHCNVSVIRAQQRNKIVDDVIANLIPRRAAY